MCGVQYDEKLCNLLDTYDKLFLVHADNVGSKQFQDIRRVSQLAPCSSALLKRLAVNRLIENQDNTLLLMFSLRHFCLQLTSQDLL